MSVQNIECQIAQAQISRLLINEPLGQAIMADLEVHVAACPDCQAFIMSRNQSLDVVVGGAEKPAKARKTSKPKQETQETIKSTDEERLAFEKLFNPKAPKVAIETKRESTTASTFWKPLAYSGALAAVLFAMSYVMKNPTALFGDRAITTVSADAKTASGDKTSNTSHERAAETTPPSAAQPTSDQTPDDSPADERPLSIKKVESTKDTEPIARADVKAPEAAELGAYVKAPAMSSATVKPVSKPSNPVSEPKAETKARPRVRIRQIHPKRVHRAHKPQVRKPRTSVRFYDSNGRPL